MPEQSGELSEWQKLGLNKFALWQRFKRYELPDPELEALVELQKNRVQVAGVQANPDKY